MANFDLGLMGTTAKDMFGPVAVMAKNLKARWKISTFKPRVKSSSSNFIAPTRTSAVNMIQRKKYLLFNSTTFAFTAVALKGFLAPLFRIGVHAAFASRGISRPTWNSHKVPNRLYLVTASTASLTTRQRKLFTSSPWPYPITSSTISFILRFAVQTISGFVPSKLFKAFRPIASRTPLQSRGKIYIHVTHYTRIQGITYVQF